MRALSTQALIAAADSFAGFRVAGDELASVSLAELVRRQAGLRGAGPWDIALMHHWGFWSQYDHAAGSSLWPFGATALAEDLAAFGAERGFLREEPREGDLFLQYSPRRGAFVRGGVVAHVYGGRPEGADYWDVLAIEGNTGERGELGGSGAERIVRRLSAARGDRFVRWTASQANQCCVTREEMCK